MTLSVYSEGGQGNYTLADLKDRMIRETNRDDLTDANPSDSTAASAKTLTLCIYRAIEYYADERFWFNEGIYPTTTTSQTVGGEDTVSIPSGMQFFDRLSVQVGGSRFTLNRVELTDWDRVAGYVTSNGQPIIYAVLGDTVRLWPTPNTAYALVWVGVVDQPSFLNDASSNAWTNEAQDLIAARARFLLMRDYFRDPDGARIAESAEVEALNSLRSKTAKRIGVGRLKASW